MKSNLNIFLPPTAKVWVYIASKSIDVEQHSFITKKSNEFLQQWVSHGEPVRGTIDVLDQYFIVIIADDCNGNLCGRAQDAQVRFIKELDEVLQLNLLDRMKTAYLDQENQVTVLPLNDFKQKLVNGSITKQTTVFNTMVNTLKGFETGWKIPLHESWQCSLLTS